MLTKVNYLNQRSEDRGGLGCTLDNKKRFIMEFIYCRRLNSKYFGAPKMRGSPAVAGIAGVVPTPLLPLSLTWLQSLG